MILSGRILNSVLLICTSILRLTASQSILSCSGYVKSSLPIDFTRINVGLFTEHGSQRQNTDCAPNTGFFFLPVEQHGNYVLKVTAPRGWSVAPQNLDLQIDGSSDPCSQQEDIVLTFEGFSISGKITSRDKEAHGANGIHVTVRRKGELSILTTVLSNDNGAFEFKGLPPSDYIVAIGDQSLESFSFEKREQEVVVKDDAVHIPAFLIIGYDIEGIVTDGKNSNVQGLKVSLKQEQKGLLQSTMTDVDGKYRFSNVSRGSYVIAPMTENKGFTVKPSQFKLEVFDKNVVADKFVVDEITMHGRVILDDSEHLMDVEVVVKQGSSFETTVYTHKDGIFTIKVPYLEQVSISCSKTGFLFDDIVAKIVPGEALPDIRPAKFKVAGFIEEAEAVANLKVLFKSKNSGTIAADVKSGHFSTFLTSGEYTATIDSGVHTEMDSYVPKELKVNVKNRPVENLSFMMARYAINGAVKCFEGTCDDVKLILSSSIQHEKVATEKTTASGQFTFKDIRQGKYTLRIVSEKQCWVQDEKEINVRGDVSDVNFQQAGHLITVNSDQSTKLILVNTKTGSKNSHDIRRGDQKICMHGRNRLGFEFDGCYIFEATPSTIVPGVDQTLTLTTVSYKIKGQILSDKPIPDLEVKASSDDRGIEVLNTLKVENGYGFELSASISESLEITPYSKKTFFNPKHYIVRVREKCEENVIQFKAREGVFIQGSLSPPVEGALVEIDDDESGTRITALSEKDGSFKIGPFLSHKSQKIRVTKDGFHFEETDKYGKFRSRQLSSITIKIQDESSQPLSDPVVVAISGGPTNYKDNAQTVDGVVKFGSLQPGDYFVTAFLKEWNFEPKNLIVKLDENSDEVKTLVGNRIAYSAFGQVVYLNGNRASGIVVLGLGGETCKDKVEDTITGNDGSFRLRGLDPNCRYDLTSGSKEVQSLILPNKEQIDPSRGDVKISENLVAHLKVDSFDISAKIKTSAYQQRKTIPLRIEKENGVTVKVHDLVPNQLHFLPPLPVIDSDYVFKVDDKVIKRIPKANSHFQYVTMDLQNVAKATRQEPAGRMYFLFPLSVLGLVIGVVGKRVYKQRN